MRKAATVLEKLEQLEQFRLRVEKGETSGTLDWAIRMCQSIIADGQYMTRSEWMYWMKKKWTKGKYSEGEIIEWCGKSMRVEEIYQLTDKEMLERELVHKYRVRVRNTDDPSDVHDFAISEG